MTSKERRKSIIDILERYDYRTVEQLASQLDVSCMTIRRDLSLLEKEDMIIRCHGGAGSNRFHNVIPPAFIVREFYSVESKKRIAANATQFFRKGSAIFIDSSSTAFVLARFITPEHRLRIITNSLRVVNELAERKINVYCTGGKYYPSEQAYYGKIAGEALEQYHFDAAFVSPRGYVSGDGAYDSTEHEAQMHRLAISLSDKVYYVCTKGKINSRFQYRVCDMSCFDKIIFEDSIITP